MFSSFNANLLLDISDKAHFNCGSCVGCDECPEEAVINCTAIEKLKKQLNNINFVVLPFDVPPTAPPGWHYDFDGVCSTLYTIDYKLGKYGCATCDNCNKCIYKESCTAVDDLTVELYHRFMALNEAFSKMPAF